ncbi:transcription factor NIGTH1 isoform X1 [Dendrobium catenatum]|uniref:Two-component response regulator ARR1 n=1 Tax=Dendrobium catenatum TaxID=906689 RepID=A0A2I0WVN2_9ASPA|nr:transcription factor NIGTH1 isoform X1 [Dendrobium catenatum]PKU79703.1 Two-component response regulator ARR1 [Dendrobium catenatum]
MGSLAPELGLDLKLFTKRTIFSCLKDEIPDGSRASKLEDFARRLEEERRKIEAFQRELPLCMLLLADVIGGLKLEMDQCQSGGSDDCVLEEFIPLQTRSDGYKEEKKAINLEEKSKEKMEWMSSAQLWSDNLSYESIDCKEYSQEQKKDEGSHSRRDCDALSLESKSDGAFLPFTAMPAPRKEEENLSIPLPDLSFVPLPIKVPCSAPMAVTREEDNHSSGLNSKAVTIASSSTGNNQLGLMPQQQYQQHPQRKARRCWSPELHRRFIIALQQLGGAQVATPKQIRELMKVDGLTNDEVKSHLQKYRLHTRRVPTSAANQVNRPVVMVGGLWVSQDHCSTSQQNASQSRSPQGPLQLTCTAQALSVTGGDSCDDDGKSESYSWK